MRKKIFAGFVGYLEGERVNVAGRIWVE